MAPKQPRPPGSPTMSKKRPSSKHHYLLYAELYEAIYIAAIHHTLDMWLADSEPDKKTNIQTAIRNSHFSPIIRLAEEGNGEAVKACINCFPENNIKLYALATYGAAKGNQLALWNDLRAQLPQQQFLLFQKAVEGAIAGYHEGLLDHIIAESEKQLLHHDGVLQHAAYYAAKAGHGGLVNKLICHDTTSANAKTCMNEKIKLYNAVVNGATAGEQLDYERRAIRLIASIQSQTLRQMLAGKRAEIISPYIFPASVILAESDKLSALTISQLIMKSQLNLNQIKAWTTCLSLHYWFLMGIEKVNNGQLSFNNFIDIASWVAGNLSRKETQSLFELHNAHIPEKLRDVSLAKTEKKHYSFWNKTKRYFSNEKKQEQCINFEKERNKIEERYQARKFSL